MKEDKLRLNICYLPLRFQMGGKSERLVATKKQLLSLPRVNPLASRKSGPSASLLFFPLNKQIYNKFIP